MELRDASLQLREKLISCGAAQLSDPELLAVLISSGNRHKSCLQLALELLKHHGDLRAVLNSPYRQFSKIKGLGVVRYAQLQAAREICRRSDQISLIKSTQLQSSEQSFSFLKRQMRDLRHESVAIIFLDSQNRVLGFETLFQGTINSTSIYIRPIIDRVLSLNAAAIILAHNHPSGLCEPSPQDIEVTQKIQQALELIEIKLIDHIVVGDNEVYSIMASQKWACV